MKTKAKIKPIKKLKIENNNESIEKRKQINYQLASLYSSSILNNFDKKSKQLADDIYEVDFDSVVVLTKDNFFDVALAYASVALGKTSFTDEEFMVVDKICSHVVSLLTTALNIDVNNALIVEGNNLTEFGGTIYNRRAN